jgi:hypothetical protein
MVKTKSVALISEREKMPFEVTPFMPYLTIYAAPGTATQTAEQVKPSAATADTEPQQVPKPVPAPVPQD